MIEFRQIDDADPVLAHSPMVRAMEKTFEYAIEHGGIVTLPSSIVSLDVLTMLPS